MAANGESQDGDVDGAGTEAVEKGGRDFFDDGELNLRIFSREGREARREEVGGNGGNDADGDGAADKLFAFDDISFGGFQFAKNRAGARQKGLAKFGKPDGTAEAIEETTAGVEGSSAPGRDRSDCAGR